MDITIFDINKDVVDACKVEFMYTNVKCINECFENIESDLVVTAGNSYGIMSGGIDLAVRKHLGWQIQDSVQNEIVWGHDGFLPVGKIVDVPVETVHANQDRYDVPHLLYCPTMEKPGTLIDPEDVYFVACKIFRYVIYLQNKQLRKFSIAICGLGTATGGISAETFAEMIYRAYEDVVGVDYEE